MSTLLDRRLDKLFPTRGGFCSRCDKPRNHDGTLVTQKCTLCEAHVCKECGVFSLRAALRTFCSMDCITADYVQSLMLGDKK